MGIPTHHALGTVPLWDCPRRSRELSLLTLDFGKKRSLSGKQKKAPPERKRFIICSYFDVPLELLLKAGTLTAAIAEEVQTAAADFAVTVYNDLVDAGRAGQESTFNADTVGRDTADGESGIGAVIVGIKNDALEFLNTVTVAFLDLYMNGDLVTGEQIRDIRIDRSFNCS